MSNQTCLLSQNHFNQMWLLLSRIDFSPKFLAVLFSLHWNGHKLIGPRVPEAFLVCTSFKIHWYVQCIPFFFLVDLGKWLQLLTLWFLFFWGSCAFLYQEVVTTVFARKWLYGHAVEVENSHGDLELDPFELVFPTH